ncbi:hypothetical protein [Micromonospora violae]|uniref:hypothetical protein n=1 Tax=Micromonospora violae TaxID=1278207 RepID=UPI0033DAFB5C
MKEMNSKLRTICWPAASFFPSPTKLPRSPIPEVALESDQPYRALRHRVDQSIMRDVLVARRPA